MARPSHNSIFENSNTSPNKDFSHINCNDCGIEIQQVFCHPDIYEEPHDSFESITDFNAKKLEEVSTYTKILKLLVEKPKEGTGFYLQCYQKTVSTRAFDKRNL